MSEQPLDLLLTAVEQSLRPRLPELGSFLRGPLLSVPVTLPAVALEYAEMVPGRDPGSGEIALLCRMQASILVACDDSAAEQLALRCVDEMLVALRALNWDLDLEPVSLVHAQPETDNPALSSCRVRLAEWHQPLLLGEPEWLWEDQPPGTLVLGFDPDTGAGHERDYFAPEDMQ